MAVAEQWKNTRDTISMFKDLLLSGEAIDQLIGWCQHGLVDTRVDLAVVRGRYADEEDQRFENNPVPLGLWRAAAFRSPTFWRSGDAEIDLDGRVRNLFGVKFDSQQVAARLPKTASAAVEGDGGDEATKGRPRLSDASLAAFLDLYANQHDLAVTDIDRKALPAIRAFFPDKHIARDRFREALKELSPHRQPGRSPIAR